MRVKVTILWDSIEIAVRIVDDIDLVDVEKYHTVFTQVLPSSYVIAHHDTFHLHESTHIIVKMELLDAPSENERQLENAGKRR